ncbi:MAG TPA: dockerin type I repeat-containing protein [Phycisphaerae bacterium]|nr:hypothetical protein [Phycisphaerales bacterium]HRX86178.1 dockerin type I repeat-containing protein [Phycisphaerae bacterium]
MKTRMLIAGALLALGIENTHAADCARLQVDLVSSAQPQLRDPIGGFSEFDGPDDHAIYLGGTDWVIDEDTGQVIDGVIDTNGPGEVLDFGMIFANAGDAGGYDRQVKQLHEYRLGPAYAAGVDDATLESAKLRIVIDHVIDVSLSGATDLVGPATVYVNVFAGDGVLNAVPAAQADFDRCDRKLPATWDVVHALESPRGFLISQDEIDFYGGAITVDIDVTAQVRSLLAADEPFAGFTLAGSDVSDFVWLSVDGGGGIFMQLPRLILTGPFRGDLDGSTTIDLLDFAALQRCQSGPGIPAAPGCAAGDLDQDGDVDVDDAVLQIAQLHGPDDPCADATLRTVALPALDEQAGRVRRGLLGDFNGDGAVNAADRAFFESCVAAGGGAVDKACRSADLTHDGVVDEADARLFRGIFGPPRAD